MVDPASTALSQSRVCVTELFVHILLSQKENRDIFGDSTLQESSKLGIHAIVTRS